LSKEGWDYVILALGTGYDLLKGEMLKSLRGDRGKNGKTFNEGAPKQAEKKKKNKNKGKKNNS
jgi:hypothetical protein